MNDSRLAMLDKHSLDVTKDQSALTIGNELGGPAAEEDEEGADL